jgi:hypothetical protein
VQFEQHSDMVYWQNDSTMSSFTVKTLSCDKESVRNVLKEANVGPNTGMSMLGVKDLKGDLKSTSGWWKQM